MKKWLLLFLAAMLCCPCAASAEEHHLTFYGDWDMIRDMGYQTSLAELFDTTYPRLYARWGMGEAPAGILFGADKDETGVAYSYGNHVVVSVNYANQAPLDRGYFSHELTHSVQQYGDRIHHEADAWWTENMANYGRFRYFHWADKRQMESSSAEPEAWMDWGYQPYGNSQWFFAYMDARYPTQLDDQGNVQYGLIDSIHLLIRHNDGDPLDDDPYDVTTPMNLLVKEITGYESIEALRLHFVQELQEGSWRFDGFAGYPDNWITEGLPGVEEPTYPMRKQANHGCQTADPMDAILTGDNLCDDAVIAGVSGCVNEREAPELLIDGDLTTKWCSTQSSVTRMDYFLDGALQWIVIDLGAEKAFNTYTVVNTRTREPAYGNMVAWELLISNDGENWTSIDYQPSCDADMASFDVGDQQARYLLVKIFDPDDGQAGTIRLYEFMLFQR